mgnify:CR=1 FL=1
MGRFCCMYTNDDHVAAGHDEADTTDSTLTPEEQAREDA